MLRTAEVKVRQESWDNCPAQLANVYYKLFIQWKYLMYLVDYGNSALYEGMKYELTIFLAKSFGNMWLGYTVGFHFIPLVL